jgi:hypothetical protein
MNKRNQCRNCVESVRVTDEIIQELLKETVEDTTNIVSDEDYENRLKDCKSCPSLLYGTTCSHNGFIVQYKARIKNSSCPMPSSPRW